MKKQLARKIKKIRKNGATFRRLATIISEEYPKDKYPVMNIHPGNQIEGIQLCKEAGEILEEDFYAW